jgi:hypothetical protein
VNKELAHRRARLIAIAQTAALPTFVIGVISDLIWEDATIVVKVTLVVLGIAGLMTTVASIYLAERTRRQMLGRP